MRLVDDRQATLDASWEQNAEAYRYLVLSEALETVQVDTNQVQVLVNLGINHKVWERIEDGD